MKNKLNRLEENQRVDELAISDENKKLIDSFIEDYISHLDSTRIGKYKYSMIRFAHLIFN